MQSFPTIAQIFDNRDVAAALIFIAAAIAGQVGHGVKKSLAGESSCVDWFRRDARRTLAAVVGNVGGMIMFVQTGVLGPILAQPNGWWALILFGLTNGFATDSALNKAGRAEWSAEERAAHEQKPPQP